MSYQKYAYPAGGYNVGTGKGYLGKPPAPALETVPKVEPFTEMSAIFDGAGKYHINHFIGYFKLAPGVKYNVRGLTELFYDKFCPIFSVKNIATAKPGEIKYKGFDTVRFTFGGDLESDPTAGGLAHDDWVYMQMDPGEGKSFYGVTLRRLWMEQAEIQLLASSVGMYANKSTLLSIMVNQHHFLAGRRSWRVEFDASRNMYSVETAAFERNSLSLYSKMEEFSSEMRASIIALWTHMVENFAEEVGGQLNDSYLTPGYEFEGKVAHRVGASKSAEEVLNASWFAPVLRKHPGLVRDL